MINTNTFTMHLLITGKKLIKDLRKEFSLLYPFLQVEFFNNKNSRKKRYPALQMIDHGKALGDAWIRKQEKGYIEVQDSMTVLELENILMDEFGLSAQVFRKSGNIWLETTMTDDWTLKQQNDHGREISLSYKEGNKEFDFDLSRDS